MAVAVAVACAARPGPRSTGRGIFSRVRDGTRAGGPCRGVLGDRLAWRRSEQALEAAENIRAGILAEADFDALCFRVTTYGGEIRCIRHGVGSECISTVGGLGLPG